MQISYIELTYWQVALAASLIVLNAAISIVLRLGMERTLAVAAVRMTLQLLLVGLVLNWVFRVERWYIVLAMLAVMTLIAGATSVDRNARRYRGIWIDTIVSIWASSWLVAAFGVFGILHDLDTWYHPQYAIPLLGMILGNTLNGISVGMATYSESLVARRAEVDTLLALGATRWEAGLAPMQHAMRTGMTPIVNAMMVAGVVSLPGMMTGQMLAGVMPIEAVKYQIVIMFLIAAATALGTAGVVLLGFRRLFTADHQFLPAKLQASRRRLG